VYTQKIDCRMWPL